MTFSIATWNVNSLRVRLPHVLQWLAEHQPDVLALQETKLIDTHFPHEELLAAGYYAVCSGQPTYNGVALLSRVPLIDSDAPHAMGEQKRVLAATVNDIRIVNLYVPNGASVDSDKYIYKLDWLNKVTQYLQQQLLQYPNLVVLGDFNIAPEDRDVHDPKAWAGQVLVSEPERTAFQELLSLGLSDIYRHFEAETGHYTWWDYRMGAFRRNNGLRIDHILVSYKLMRSCASCVIDTTPRTCDRPSDHVPVTLKLNSL